MTTTSPTGLAVGRWTVDPAHSTATFRVRSLGRTVSPATPAVSPHDGSATVTAHTQLDRRTLGIRAPAIVIGHAIDITITATLRLTALARHDQRA